MFGTSFSRKGEALLWRHMGWRSDPVAVHGLAKRSCGRTWVAKATTLQYMGWRNDTLDAINPAGLGARHAIRYS